jgi:hypothetical protein
MAQHKWHKEINAWADGAVIQFKLNGKWIDCQDNDPAWQADTEYQIKPKSNWNKEKEAYDKGEKLEFKLLDKWHEWNYSFEPHWDDAKYTFRIKPQTAAKCIVKDCMNHTNEGKFVGELCAPCWDYITNGNGVHSQAYRNAQPKDEKPKYLYVWLDKDTQLAQLETYEPKGLLEDGLYKYIGKIKLEVDDVGSA